MVTTCLGRRSLHAAETAARHGVAKVCDSLDALLAEPLDAVTIALPPAEVSHTLERVLERRLPVLCEKPVGTSADEAEQLARLASQFNIVTAVDFQFRYVPAFQILASKIRSQTIGAFCHASIEWHVYSFSHRNHKWSWKTDADQGGGVMTLLGSHLVDLIEWVLGPISRIYAHFDRRATQEFCPLGASAAEDSAALTIELVAGGTVTVSLSNASPGQTRHRWTIVGDQGTLILDNSSTDYMTNFSLAQHSSCQAPFLIELLPGSSAADGRLPPFRALASSFLNQVRGKLPVDEDMPTLVHGARSQRLLTAAKQSNQIGQSIRIT